MALGRLGQNGFRGSGLREPDDKMIHGGNFVELPCVSGLASGFRASAKLPVNPNPEISLTPKP